MIKFKVSSYIGFPVVKLDEVERETESSIWIDGHRHNKVGSYERYFDSYEEAKLHLVKQGQEEVERCAKKLKNAEAYLAKAQALKESP